MDRKHFEVETDEGVIYVDTEGTEVDMHYRFGKGHQGHERILIRDRELTHEGMINDGKGYMGNKANRLRSYLSKLQTSKRLPDNVKKVIKKIS